MRSPNRGWHCCSLLLAASCAWGCTASVGDGAASSGQAARVAVSVQPSVAYVVPGTRTRFSASVTGTTRTGVQWAVLESGGGSVDTSGNYLAPTQPGTYHVRAVAVADQDAAGTAQVTVTRSGGSNAACATEPVRTSGPVYYYCECQPGAADGCAQGNDANAGTDPGAPRRTLADAVTRFNAMAAGATVAFCRGGAFAVSATATLRNARCTATAPCDFRDYAPSGMETAPRPVFLAGGITFLAVSGSGIHKEGYRFWNLEVRHTGGEGVSFDIGDSSTDMDVCNVAASGGRIGLLEQTTNQRLTIRNSQWSGFSQHGMLVGSTDLLIDSNTFDDAGANGGNQTHVIYLQGGKEQSPDGYHNERVVNNDIHLSNCTGPILIANGRNNDMVIENNRITVENGTGSCYGMGIGHGGYGYGCWHNRAAIRRNRITIPVCATGIAVSVCADCTITDNSVALTSRTNGYFGIHLVTDFARTSVYPEETPTTRAVVQNNSIYLPYDADASSGTAIRIENEGSGYVVENNAAWTTGASCYNVLAPVQSNTNNFCRGSAGGAALSAIWTNAAAGDLTLASGSPLIGFGSSGSYSPLAMSSVWSTTDPGVARTPPIDAGAFAH